MKQRRCLVEVVAPIKTDNSTIHAAALALDVGEKRIGVAVANLEVRFARPLTTLDQPERFVTDIVALVRSEDAAYVVLGLPRGLDGQETAQTAYVRDFYNQLLTALGSAGLQIPLYWIDEALTSAKAERELAARGKPYAKGAIDALAATYILEDYLHG